MNKYQVLYNKPARTGNEHQYVQEALANDSMSGDGVFTQRCHAWFEEYLQCEKALLTPSCTHALELAALLIEIDKGDEVIMPSFTFPSTANAFALRGAEIVFIDIDPATMNMDAGLIESAITSQTKAIVPVHYAGVGCDMNSIMALAEKHNLFVIEDAAQCMGAAYEGKQLGTLGHLGTFSFHETKNFTSAGEGGLLIVNDPQFTDRAEIIREKGTNRAQFFKGLVDKYSWVDIGSSYLPSDVQAAYLWGQLEKYNEINQNRLNAWNYYYSELKSLVNSGDIRCPEPQPGRVHNGHIFYLKTESAELRDELLAYMQDQGVLAIFHYVPLHSADAGRRFGRFVGQDQFTSVESARIVRLPIYYGISKREQDIVIETLHGFFR